MVSSVTFKALDPEALVLRGPFRRRQQSLLQRRNVALNVIPKLGIQDHVCVVVNVAGLESFYEPVPFGFS